MNSIIFTFLKITQVPGYAVNDDTRCHRKHSSWCFRPHYQTTSDLKGHTETFDLRRDSFSAICMAADRRYPRLTQTQKCPRRSTRCSTGEKLHAWYPESLVCRRPELVSVFFGGVPPWKTRKRCVQNCLGLSFNTNTSTVSFSRGSNASDVSESLATSQKKKKQETKKMTWEGGRNNKVRKHMLNIICPSPSPRGIVVHSNMAT